MNKIGVVGFLCAISLGIFSPRAEADPWNQKTTVTFNEAVQVPGKELPLGTYVFKLAESTSDRDIVEVYNEKETHLIGTFPAVPDYRLKPAGKTIITFSERPAGTPEALRAWFYPGENFGHQFVYPKSRATELAKANHQPVASMEDQSGDAAAMKKARLKAQRPTGEEVDVPDAFGAPPQQTGTRK